MAFGSDLHAARRMALPAGCPRGWVATPVACCVLRGARSPEILVYALVHVPLPLPVIRVFHVRVNQIE